MRADLILAERFELAEGPVWFDDALHWVDLRAGDLHCWDPATGRRDHRHVGAPLGNAVPAGGGEWLAARGRELVRFDWVTGRVCPLATVEDDQPENRFNDGKCDPRGRWFAGSMHTGTPRRATGALYRCGGGGECLPVRTDVSLSNGLGWSPDARWFYHTDSETRRLDIYEYDVRQGTLGVRRTLVLFTESDGVPDGLCVDAEGHVWIALWGGGAVVRVDGRNGRELLRVVLPAAHVSSCTFGGPALDELYITTATANLSPTQRAAQPAAGGIFRARPGVTGLPVTPAAPHLFPVASSSPLPAS